LRVIGLWDSLRILPLFSLVYLWWGWTGIDWRINRRVELPGCKRRYRERKL